MPSIVPLRSSKSLAAPLGSREPSNLPWWCHLSQVLSVLYAILLANKVKRAFNVAIGCVIKVTICSIGCTIWIQGALSCLGDAIWVKWSTESSTQKWAAPSCRGNKLLITVKLWTNLGESLNQLGGIWTELKLVTINSNPFFWNNLSTDNSIMKK